MEQQNRAILTTELSQQITACTFTKEDLKILCDILQESSHEAAKEEVSHYALWISLMSKLYQINYCYYQDLS